MVERKEVSPINYKLIEFADQIAFWDKRIIRILANGKLKNGEWVPGEVINLICCFLPEPPDAKHGIYAINTLLMRNDLEHVSDEMNISFPFELGFQMGGKVYLSNGDKFDTIGDHLILWPYYAERKYH